MRVKILFISLLVSGLSQAQNYLPKQNPDFYYSEAISLYQSEDYTAAKHLIDEFLEMNETPEALYYRAMSAIRAEQKSGEHYVNTFVKDYPLHPLAHKAKFELAHHCFSKRNYQKTLLSYGGMEMSTLSDKQAEQAYFEKGYSLLQLKVTAQGIEAMKAANALNGEYKSASAYYLGVMSEEQESEKWFLQASEDGDWRVKSAVYLSQIYLGSGDFEKLQKMNVPILTIDKTADNSNLHFYTAESYYQQNKFKQAVRYYTDALDLNVGKPTSETLFKIGHAYYEIGEKEKAIDQLKLSGLDETATGQASAFQLAKIYTEVGQFSNALNAYEIAGSVDHDPDIQEEAKFLVGKISVQLEQYDQAISSLEILATDYPSGSYSNEANELLSTAYLNSSNYDLVIAHYEKSNSSSTLLRKNYQQVMMVKGMQSFSDRKVEEAAVLFGKSVKSPIDKQWQVEGYYWLGECRTQLGQIELAREAYQQAKTLDRSNPLPEYGLGYLSYNEKDYAKAREFFVMFKSKSSSGHTFWNDARLRIADCEYATKQYDQALKGYNSLSGTSVAQDYIYFQIGLIHQLNGNVGDAVASFERVIQMQNSVYRDNALFQMAQTQFEDADFPAAITSFSSYINQYSDQTLAPYASIRRALCYSNTSDLESSKADYLFVLNNNIGHPASQNALLGIQELQRKGIAIDFDTYLAAYRSAHPDDSSLESIEFEQAKTLYFSQNYAQAIQKLKGFLAKNPNGAFKEDIIYYLGDANDKSGNFDEANTYYEQIIDMAPSKYLNRVLDKRGRLLLDEKNGSLAIDNYNILKSYSKNRKENYLAIEGLMKAYFFEEQYDRSIEEGRKITEAEWKPSNAENEASLYIGRALVFIGDSTSAIDEFLKVINGGTDELAAQAKYRIGEIQYNQGRNQASLETLFQLNSSFGAYQNWIGRSFLLIADNYLAIDELLQAKATLNSLVEKFPDEEVKKRARKKLVEINRKQDVEIATDTIK